MSIPGNINYDTIILGEFKFPDGDPASFYVMGLGKMLSDIGLAPLFLGVQSKQAGFDSFDGFPYVSDGFSHKHAAFRMFSSLTHTSHTMDRLKQCDNESVKYIIAYHPNVYLTQYLVDYCKKKKKRLIICVTEWYELDSVTLGRFGPFALDSELRLRKAYWKADALIVISSFLKSYYSGMKTIIIPPTLDVTNISSRIDLNTNKCLKLSYTGHPGKKDILLEVIKAMGIVDPKGESIEFVIAGINNLQLKKLNGEYPSNVNAIGRVSRSSAIEMTMNSDFSVLFRRPLRYAMAGFATKVPESLSVGTPLICNPTSDLLTYLTDDKDSIITKHPTCESIVSALERALFMSDSQRGDMRKEARQTALKHFDYRAYKQPLYNFLNNI